MKKVILCLFGVIPRSIKYTFNSIKENIIDHLKNDNYNLEIYVFNLNIKDALIDDIRVNNDDINIIPYDYFEEYDQEDLDKTIIHEIKKKYERCFTRDDYNDKTTNNALRQMYSEYRVGLFLEKNINKWDIAIVCGPDLYLTNKINRTDIKNAMIDNCIYTTLANEGRGYTNAFYIGGPSILIQPLKRIEYVYKYFPTDMDYEYILKRSIDDNNIKKKVTDLLFVKIRANKNVFFYVNNPKYINHYGILKFKEVLKNFQELIIKLRS